MQISDEFFSRDVFAALLESLPPLARNVNALASLAVRHAAFRDDVGAAITDSMLSVAPSSPERRALWFLIDALMKLSPLVFVPVFAPNIATLVRERIPWEELLQPRTTDADGNERPLWFEAMLATWAEVLPPQRYRDVAKVLAKERSTRELQRELLRAELLARKRKRREGGKNAALGDGEGGTRDGATAQQLRQLDDDWRALQRVIRGVANDSGDTSSGGQNGPGAPAGSSSALNPDANGDDYGDEYSDDSDAAATQRKRTNLTARRDKPVRAARNHEEGIHSDGDDDEDDSYIPQFISGATGNIGDWDDGKGKQRRAPRVRKL